MKTECTGSSKNQHGLDMGSGSATLFYYRYTDDDVVFAESVVRETGFFQRGTCCLSLLNYEMAAVSSRMNPGMYYYHK